jgi:hypothetical protein
MMNGTEAGGDLIKREGVTSRSRRNFPQSKNVQRKMKYWN